MNILRILMLISIVCLVAEPVRASKKRRRRRLKALEERADSLTSAFSNLSEAQNATEARLDDIEFMVEDIKNDMCPKSDLPKNCIEVRQRDPGASHGYYNISINDDQDVAEVYCDFHGTRGHMFVSRGALSKLASLEGLYTISDHAVIRVLYNDNRQHAVRVSQITKYQFQYALSFQISKADGYKLPMNDALKPYMYLGFIPRDIVLLKTKTGGKPTVGYKAGVEDVLYQQCDSNPNSYIAFFGNDGNVTEHPRWMGGGDNVRMRKWFLNDELVPTNRYLREEDFFFYEMHCGGCGGYISSSLGNKYGVKAATLGLGFDIRPRC